MSKNQTKIRVAATVSPLLHDVLLLRYPPRHSVICADTVTYAYKVERDMPYPFEGRDVAVQCYGLWSDHNFDALLLSIDGQATRPDGFMLSLTLSLAPGVDRIGALLTAEADLSGPQFTEVSWTLPLRFHRQKLSNLAARPAVMAA